jgi:hypothetical protein
VAGPSLVNGDELATFASQALGVDLKFDDISEYVQIVFFFEFLSQDRVKYGAAVTQRDDYC